MNNIVDKSVKIKLSLYGLFSAITYIYLLLPVMPGISVPIFIILQFISIYFVIKDRSEVKNKYGILVMVPIFILSLNRYISGSELWRTSNFFVILFLYSVMILVIGDKLNFKKDNLIFVIKIIFKIFEPFTNFSIPIKWYSLKEGKENKRIIIKRVLIGIVVSIPCVLFLLVMLSSADMIFSNKMNLIFNWIFDDLNFEYIIKLLYGAFAGLYLFGLLYSLFNENSLLKKVDKTNLADDFGIEKRVNGDLIIFNILLFSILIVYSLFIVIQFKYLFSGAKLPYGLNYSDYARRGFFELLLLSILNIGLILVTEYFLQDKIYVNKYKWAQITKVFMMYLGFLTLVMLISSFYRMMLYDNEYGYTRLRVLVYLFLIFESAGLLMTFKFILKPNFNIFIGYLVIGLIYYLSLNVIQIDRIIARRNIDMYFNGQTETIDVNYLMTLSIDAVPEIIRLSNSDSVDILTKYKADTYLDNISLIYNNMDLSWRSNNLSINRAKKLIKK
ncbi:hypothetical protein J2Z76_001357 [Sedimentibacter acidaminivorans]|uniref:DUF4173 domain-containing protein n=1 Tax=Sedimentibacter acidaminivorans TaxID=913099 RepID=A0ABS4GCS7_9FIRM|nr:DUF4173 domain-containing protein [Sedimentibacter acidaminivorans]MBP1925498.1 hypothetical protein [Sedimentibacter acidaminivorans]